LRHLQLLKRAKPTKLHTLRRTLPVAAIVRRKHGKGIARCRASSVYRETCSGGDAAMCDVVLEGKAMFSDSHGPDYLDISTK
jgi:hypothetical protein